MTEEFQNTATETFVPVTPPAETKPPIDLTPIQKAMVQGELAKQQQHGKHKHNKGKVGNGGTSQSDPPTQATLPMPKTVASLPDPLLVDILCWPRRHESPCEAQFLEWLKARPMMVGHDRRVLSQGSFAIEVKGPDWEQRMFSCHVDTQDDVESCKDTQARKKLVYDSGLQVITLDSSHKIGSCLGADDGAGVWLMLRMIEAKVPGTYVFHRGEECGGVSAKANVANHAEYFKKRRFAIAFDRAGDRDVINTQGGCICASTKFSDALAAALNEEPDFQYKSCTMGVYTDTKDYRGLISECINISVGYQSQHGPSEFQDWSHLKTLATRLIKLDWSKLPITREPYMAPPYVGSYQPSGNYPRGPNGYGNYPRSGGSSNAKELQDDFFGNSKKSKPGGSRTKKIGAIGSADLDGVTYGEIVDAFDEDPGWAADVVFALLRERHTLKADIEFLEGLVHDLR